MPDSQTDAVTTLFAGLRAHHRQVAAAVEALGTLIDTTETTVLNLITTQPEPDPEPEPTQVVRINIGGPALTVNGVTWDADRGYTGGQTSSQGAGHYTAPSIYDTERWGSRFSYALSGLPVGPAEVRLHLAENHPPTDRPGERIFTVEVNGTSLGDVDIIAEAGGQYTPTMVITTAVVPTTGRLHVTLTSRVNAATLHGLEVRCFGTVPPAPDPEPPTPPTPAGFWYSGVQSHQRARIDAWTAMRRRPVDLVLTYTTRTGSWDQLVLPSYATDIAGTDRNMVVMIGQPFTPNSLGDAPGTRPTGKQARAILSGAGDAHWRRWGQTLAAKVAAGYPEYLTNLCWEFNGDWYPHSAANPAEFVAAWRRVVTTVRSVHSTARFVWTVNAGYSQNPPSHDPVSCWPGDDYVDLVGLDLYDHYPRAVGYDAVNARENTVPGRAKFWERFTEAHGKRLVLQEWGLNNSPKDVPPRGNVGGGDNPGYITWMWDWFNYLWRRGLLYGEAYFEDSDLNNVNSTLLGSANTNSKAEYGRLWTPAG